MKLLTDRSQETTYGRTTDLATEILMNGHLPQVGADPVYAELKFLVDKIFREHKVMFLETEGADENYLYWDRLLQILSLRLGREFGVSQEDAGGWLTVLRRHKILPEEAIVLMPHFRDVTRTEVAANSAREGAANVLINMLPSTMVTGTELARMMAEVRGSIDGAGHPLAQLSLKTGKLGENRFFAALPVTPDTVTLPQLSEDHPCIAMLKSAYYDAMVDQQRRKALSLLEGDMTKH